MAFRSRTDSTFLYESLHCLQREEESGLMEARVQRQSLTVGAAAAILGGLKSLWFSVLSHWQVYSQHENTIIPRLFELVWAHIEPF